jgi:hypothetical protein
MDTNYVKFKTNIKWYNAKDLVYLTLMECFKLFLLKMKEGKTTGQPIMEQELADELGASYTIEDRTPRTVPNPFYGEVLHTMEIDEKGGVVFSEGEIQTSKTVTTVPMEEGLVAADLAPALESLISEYDALEFDDLNEWYAKASKIVPFLWD